MSSEFNSLELQDIGSEEWTDAEWVDASKSAHQDAAYAAHQLAEAHEVGETELIREAAIAVARATLTALTIDEAWMRSGSWDPD